MESSEIDGRGITQRGQKKEERGNLGREEKAML